MWTSDSPVPGTCPTFNLIRMVQCEAISVFGPDHVGPMVCPTGVSKSVLFRDGIFLT